MWLWRWLLLAGSPVAENGSAEDQDARRCATRGMVILDSARDPCRRLGPVCRQRFIVPPQLPAPTATAADPTSTIMETASIDFETPALATAGITRQIINPYVDGTTGVSFTSEPARWGDEVTGVTTNRATSVCVEPVDNNQKLGTGRNDGTPGGRIGFAGFAIRATFPVPLAPPVTVSTEFQTGAGSPIRIRLFDAAGTEVASVADTAEPADGTCGYPGNPRARKTIAVTANQQVAYAILDLDTSGNVFVIDNFGFSAPSRGLDTGMLVLETNVAAGALLPGAHLERSYLEGKQGSFVLGNTTSGE